MDEMDIILSLKRTMWGDTCIFTQAFSAVYRYRHKMHKTVVNYLSKIEY